jgi:amino-acid N-acetyltransferase
VFVEAAPYLVRYRGAHFVFWIAPELTSPPRGDLFEELFILRLLGVHLTLFLGGHPDPPEPITDPMVFSRITEQELRRLSETIQSLGRGWMGIPERSYRARLTTGNLLTLRRRGIVQGVDWGFVGELRTLDSERVSAHHQAGEILIFSGVLPGATGELLWGSPLELSASYAGEIGADKLIFILPQLSLEFPREWGERKLEELCASFPSDPMLASARKALRNGVGRVHLVPGEPGALLKELLSLEGYGVLFTRHPSTELLPARSKEVEELSELLRIFEREGALAPRTHERIEQEVENYRVLKADGRIVACGALRLFSGEDFALFEAIAVRPDFQRKGLGGAVLVGLEGEARERGAWRAFIYTTRAIEWFSVRGYTLCPLEQAPATIRSFYHPDRNSTLMVKDLTLRDRRDLL